MIKEADRFAKWLRLVLATRPVVCVSWNCIHKMLGGEHYDVVIVRTLAAMGIQEPNWSLSIKLHDVRWIALDTRGIYFQRKPAVVDTHWLNEVISTLMHYGPEQAPDRLHVCTRYALSTDAYFIANVADERLPDPLT